MILIFLFQVIFIYLCFKKSSMDESILYKIENSFQHMTIFIVNGIIKLFIKLCIKAYQTRRKKLIKTRFFD